MKQHILACFIAATMMITNLVPYAAATSPDDTADFMEPKVTVSNVDGFEVEEVAPLDLSGVDPSHIIELPVEDKGLEANTLSMTDAEKIDSKDESKVISAAESLNTAICLDKNNVETESADGFTKSGTSYQLTTVSNVMGEGETQQVYSISVPSGAIVQAELQVPEILSLDYILYLCTYNSSDNTLRIVDSSNYTTNSLFLNENVSAINNTSGAVVYYIVIDSNNNPSTEDYYTLQVSTGGTADGFEPNDNGFSAFSFPEMSSNTSITVPGNLNTPIDNDWFVLYVADTSEFSGLEISNIPNNVVVESYSFTSAIEPVLHGSTENASALPIVTGYNYFRIAYDGTGTFSPTDYNIKFSPRLNVQKIVTLIAVDGYCQRSSNLFNDGITRRLLTRSADVEVKLLYATSNNIMVKTNDTVNVTIENPNWTATNMRYKTGSSTIKDKDTCIVNLRAPTIYGLSNYNFVYTTITSQTYGTLASNVQMALLDHYDDGELSRPCEHNGTCGYK